MLSNVLKNWRTSACGLVALACGAHALYHDPSLVITNPVNSIGAIAIGLGLIAAPDASTVLSKLDLFGQQPNKTPEGTQNVNGR